MEINRTDSGMHCLFSPAFRPEFALNSTFITFGEVFSVFFMQRWGELARVCRGFALARKPCGLVLRKHRIPPDDMLHMTRKILFSLTTEEKHTGIRAAEKMNYPNLLVSWPVFGDEYLDMHRLPRLEYGPASGAIWDNLFFRGPNASYFFSTKE